jgi:hypothetical protein
VSLAAVRQAKRIDRALSRARTRSSLRRILKRAVDFYILAGDRMLGRRPFLQRYARDIYILVLTRREQKEVRDQLRRWPSSYGDVESEVPGAASHVHAFHPATRECRSCYAELVEHVLLERRSKRAKPRHR